MDEGVVTDAMNCTGHSQHRAPSAEDGRQDEPRQPEHIEEEVCVQAITSRLAECLNIGTDQVPDVCNGSILVSCIWLHDPAKRASAPASPTPRRDLQVPDNSSSRIRKVKSTGTPSLQQKLRARASKKPIGDVLKAFRGPMPLLDLTSVGSVCEQQSRTGHAAAGSDMDFVVAASRARSEAVLTSGARLREHPNMSFRFGTSDREHGRMMCWRRDLGISDTLVVCVLSEEGFELEHPGLNAPHVSVVVLTSNVKLAQAVIRYRRTNPRFSVICQREFTAVDALQWVQKRHRHIAVEVGPALSNAYFRGVAPRPVMLDSVWLAGHCAERPPRFAHLFHGANAEELCDFFQQQHPREADALTDEPTETHGRPGSSTAGAGTGESGGRADRRHLQATEHKTSLSSCDSGQGTGSSASHTHLHRSSVTRRDASARSSASVRATEKDGWLWGAFVATEH